MRFIVLTILLLGLHCHAHSVRLFAAYDGNRLTGRAYSGPTGLTQVTITLLHTDGTEFGTITTDDHGNFSRAMKAQIPLKLSLSLPDGHRASYDLAWAGPNDAETPHSHDADEYQHDGESHAHDHGHEQLEAAQRETQRLREELATLQGQRHLRDVLGGIGFVFGLAGLVIVIKSRGNTSCS